MFGHNKGMGLLSKGRAGGVPGSRQMSLVCSQGFTGNGMATIGADNTFSVIAHMPSPHTLSPYPAVYAAYLVDNKGKNGFFAGTLKPAGNGIYQTNFRSPVPLVHYDKVVISLESPQSIMQAPQGPIVMKVKEGIFDGGLAPIKKVGGNIWGKMKDFVGRRLGGGPEEDVNEPVTMDQNPAQYQAPAQNYQSPQAQVSPGHYQSGYQGGSYQGSQQGGYQGSQQGGYQGGQQGGYQGSRQGGYQGSYQGNHQGSYQGNPQGNYRRNYQANYQPGFQGGRYRYHQYPQGRGMYAPTQRPSIPQPAPFVAQTPAPMQNPVSSSATPMAAAPVAPMANTSAASVTAAPAAPVAAAPVTPEAPAASMAVTPAAPAAPVQSAPAAPAEETVKE